MSSRAFRRLNRDLDVIHVSENSEKQEEEEEEGEGDAEGPGVYEHGLQKKGTCC